MQTGNTITKQLKDGKELSLDNEIFDFDFYSFLFFK